MIPIGICIHARKKPIIADMHDTAANDVALKKAAIYSKDNILYNNTSDKTNPHGNDLVSVLSYF